MRGDFELNWLIKFFRGWILNRAISMVAARLKQDKALVYALGQYQASASFLSMVRAYTINTETPGDDQVMEAIDRLQADLKERPFKEVLAGLLHGLTLPDLDGDPSNDIDIQEFIDRVVKEVTE